MCDRDQQPQDDVIITGTVEFCDNQQVAGDPWQNLFELCLHYQEIAQQ